MLNYIELEFLKLKRSRIFLLTLFGAMFPAFILFLTAEIGEFTETLQFRTFFTNVNMYMSLIFAILLFTIIISYLFGREYNEHTLKTILTAPTSRTTFIFSKYLMFLIWIVLVTIITSISAVFFGYLAGATGFSINIFLYSFKELLITNLLLFLTFSPLVFLSLLITNMIPAMIGGALLTFTNMIISSSRYSIYFPWSCPYMLASGEIAQYTSNTVISYIIIATTFMIGIILSYMYFKRRDIPL